MHVDRRTGGRIFRREKWFTGDTSKGEPELATSGNTPPGQNNQNYYRVENLARNWLQQDEKAARAWIQQAPVPEERKKALLDPKR